MRNCGNKDPHSLWLDWYPQGTPLVSQDNLLSLTLPAPHNQNAPRVLQDWKPLEDMGQALCWCKEIPLSVFRGITAHTTQISALLYLCFISLGAGQVLGSALAWGVLCWHGKPNLLFNNKCLYALLLSSLMFLFANLSVRFGVRCKYPLIWSKKQWTPSGSAGWSTLQPEQLHCFTAAEILGPHFAIAEPQIVKANIDFQFS